MRGNVVAVVVVAVCLIGSVVVTMVARTDGECDRYGCRGGSVLGWYGLPGNSTLCIGATSLGAAKQATWRGEGRGKTCTAGGKKIQICGEKKKITICGD